MFSELHVAPTFDQPRGSKAPPAGRHTSDGHAAQAGRAAAELHSPGYFLFSSSDSALRCASAPPMRMKFCTARQTSLYRECRQCTDHLEQLHESFNNADQSTHNGQHCAEVQGDGYAHVGGCAPLTCLQRTDSAVSFTHLANCQQCQLRHCLCRNAAGQSPTFAAWQGQLSLSAGAVGSTQARGAPQTALQVSVTAWSRHAGGIHCQHDLQRQAAARPQGVPTHCWQSP